MYFKNSAAGTFGKLQPRLKNWRWSKIASALHKKTPTISVDPDTDGMTCFYGCEFCRNLVLGGNFRTDNPTGVNTAGVPRTHPLQYFGLGGVNGKISQYPHTLTLAPQNTPKYAISTSQNKKFLGRGTPSPHPTPFSTSCPQRWRHWTTCLFLTWCETNWTDMSTRRGVSDRRSFLTRRFKCEWCRNSLTTLHLSN